MAFAKKAYLAIKTAEPDIAAASEEVTALDGSAIGRRAGNWVVIVVAISSRAGRTAPTRTTLSTSNSLAELRPSARPPPLTYSGYFGATCSARPLLFY
jgi:hypothetical protein